MIRYAVTFLAAITAFSPTPSASGQPVRVRVGQCNFCPMPTPVSFPDPRVPRQNPPGCFHRRTWCERENGAIYVIHGGTPGYVIGGTLECDNCINCQDCPPLPPPMLCTKNLQVCFTESVSFDIQVGGEAGKAIKAALTAAIGFSISREVCANVTCGSEAVPPCTTAKYEARMNVVTGITYEMKSTFGAGGVYSAHFRRQCSVAGSQWSQDCGVKISTVTGSKAINSLCVTTGAGGC